MQGFGDENLFSLNVDLFYSCGFLSPRKGEYAGLGIRLAGGCSGFPPLHGLSWQVLGSCLVPLLALGSLLLVFPAAWKVSGSPRRSEVPCVTQLLHGEFSSLPL